MITTYIDRERDLKKFTLLWIVKRSFVDYLSRTPGSSIELGGDATRAIDGSFAFPLSSAHTVEPGGRLVELRFAGKVAFSAHDGVLDLSLENPWITAGPEGSIISVVDPEDHSARADLAEVPGVVPRFVNSEIEFSFAEPALTALGAELLGRMYLPGIALDPLRVVSREAVWPDFKTSA